METIIITENALLIYETIVTLISMAFGAFIHQLWIDRRELLNFKEEK